MSSHPLQCSRCQQDCNYERYAPFGQGEEQMFGVVWLCPNGHGQSLEICPIGPLAPVANSCLNCGVMYAADDVCRICGLSRQGCPGALGLSQDADHDPIATAKEAFAQGLFRRGLAILNRAIAAGLVAPEAWIIKSRFLHSIGYNRSAAEMIESALNSYEDISIRIELFGEASFLWAECNRGDDAFSNAEAAFALGSRSVRTHYLRGRGLALIGRLEEARIEMTNVLALDPVNTDALRGLSMIDDVLRRAVRRPWWKLW